MASLIIENAEKNAEKNAKERQEIIKLNHQKNLDDAYHIAEKIVEHLNLKSVNDWKIEKFLWKKFYIKRYTYIFLIANNCRHYYMQGYVKYIKKHVVDIIKKLDLDYKYTVNFNFFCKSYIDRFEYKTMYTHVNLTTEVILKV